MIKFSSSLRGNYVSNCTSVISGYLTRLPRSLWLLAMTIGGAAKVAMHAGLGGAFAAASSSDVGIGMLAGGMAETLSGLTSSANIAHAFSGTGPSGTGLSNWIDTAVAFTSVLAGGSARDISTATTVSSSVVEYNAQLHQEHRDIISAANRSDSAEEKEKLENAMLAIRERQVGVLSTDKDYAEINRRVNLGREDIESQEHIWKVAKELGKEQRLERSSYEILEDKAAEYDKAYFRMEGIGKLGGGTYTAVQSTIAGYAISEVGFPMIGVGIAGAGVASGYNLAAEGNNQLWWGSTPHVPTRGARVLGSLDREQPTFFEEKAPSLAINISQVIMANMLGRFRLSHEQAITKYAANLRLVVQKIVQGGKDLRKQAAEISGSIKHNAINGWNTSTKYVSDNVEKVQKIINLGKAAAKTSEEISGNIARKYKKYDTGLEQVQNKINEAQNTIDSIINDYTKLNKITKKSVANQSNAIK